MRKVLIAAAFAGALSAPLAASAAPGSTATTVPILSQPVSSAPVPGPAVAKALTPQQISDAWEAYIAAEFHVDHSS